MVKISQLPPDTAPTVTDKIVTYDAESITTKAVLLSDLITLFFNNIPLGASSPVTRGNESFVSFVYSGLAWTADSAGVNRNASMTAGVIYINGRRLSISAVNGRTFTASKDTYVDVLDNQDGTGTVVYTEATNNAASAALAANSARIGIIITGATFIASAASINQGTVDKLLPIASSRPYIVTDSLGNRICNRDPLGKTLGYAATTSNFSTAALVATQITGLSVPFIAPSGFNVKLTFGAQRTSINAATGNAFFGVCDGVVSATTLQQVIASAIASGANIPPSNAVVLSPTSGLHTYNGEYHVDANTGTLTATTAAPTFILVERA